MTEALDLRDEVRAYRSLNACRVAVLLERQLLIGSGPVIPREPLVRSWVECYPGQGGPNGGYSARAVVKAALKKLRAAGIIRFVANTTGKSAGDVVVTQPAHLAIAARNLSLLVDVNDVPLPLEQRSRLMVAVPPHLEEAQVDLLAEWATRAAETNNPSAVQTTSINPVREVWLYQGLNPCRVAAMLRELTEVAPEGPVLRTAIIECWARHYPDDRSYALANGQSVTKWVARVLKDLRTFGFVRHVVEGVSVAVVDRGWLNMAADNLPLVESQQVIPFAQRQPRPKVPDHLLAIQEALATQQQ